MNWILKKPEPFARIVSQNRELCERIEDYRRALALFKVSKTFTAKYDKTFPHAETDSNAVKWNNSLDPDENKIN